MAEYAIKNVVLESNLSRRDRYVVLLFFALCTDIAFVLLKKWRIKNTRKKEVTTEQQNLNNSHVQLLA